MEWFNSLKVNNKVVEKLPLPDGKVPTPEISLALGILIQ